MAKKKKSPVKFGKAFAALAGAAGGGGGGANRELISQAFSKGGGGFKGLTQQARQQAAQQASQGAANALGKPGGAIRGAAALRNRGGGLFGGFGKGQAGFGGNASPATPASPAAPASPGAPPSPMTGGGGGDLTGQISDLQGQLDQLNTQYSDQMAKIQEWKAGIEASLANSPLNRNAPTKRGRAASKARENAKTKAAHQASREARSAELDATHASEDKVGWGDIAEAGAGAIPFVGGALAAKSLASGAANTVGTNIGAAGDALEAAGKGGIRSAGKAAAGAIGSVAGIVGAADAAVAAGDLYNQKMVQEMSPEQLENYKRTGSTSGSRRGSRRPPTKRIDPSLERMLKQVEAEPTIFSEQLAMKKAKLQNLLSDVYTRIDEGQM